MAQEKARIKSPVNYVASHQAHFSIQDVTKSHREEFRSYYWPSAFYAYPHPSPPNNHPHHLLCFTHWVTFIDILTRPVNYRVSYSWDSSFTVLIKIANFAKFWFVFQRYIDWWKTMNWRRLNEAVRQAASQVAELLELTSCTRSAGPAATTLSAIPGEELAVSYHSKSFSYYLQSQQWFWWLYNVYILFIFIYRHLFLI